MRRCLCKREAVKHLPTASSTHSVAYRACKLDALDLPACLVFCASPHSPLCNDLVDMRSGGQRFVGQHCAD